MRKTWLTVGLDLGLAINGLAVAGPDAEAAGPSEPTRRIAITVDDLPIAPPDRHSVDQQREITRRLLAALAAHAVPAVGFVNESKLEEAGSIDPRRVELLERWLEAGHELGNHGHSHLDLHRVEPDEWMADVVRGECVTRPLVERHGRELRWFRHPFLHTGRSVEVQRRTTDALEARGYEWIPLAEGLEHPAYGRPTDGYTGAGGITWLHRWALTEGRDPAIFAGEPDIPAWVPRQ